MSMRNGGRVMEPASVSSASVGRFAYGSSPAAADVTVAAGCVATGFAITACGGVCAGDWGVEPAP